MSTTKSLSLKDFKPSDLFKKWKVMIENADNSIKIFTPYLDSTVNKLIKSVSKDVEIQIITSLESDNLFQKEYQIDALIEAMNDSVTIKNLEGLHAKVLMVDYKNISLGSQNFTKRGRKNKEAGFISDTSFEGAYFIKVLEEWISESRDVSIELLENLKEFVSENEEEISTIKNRFDNGIEEILTNFYNKEDQNVIDYSSHYNTTYRFAQDSVIVRKTQPPPNYNYYSFFAGENNNLCKWIKTKEGVEEKLSLEEYDYYPGLNSRTMQMAFIRMHTSRITFIRTNFNFNEWRDFEIGGEEFEIEFTFLRSNTKKSNIKFSLRNDHRGKGDFYYMFNGIEFKLVKYKNENFQNIIDDGLISNKFLTFLIQPEKFKTPWGHPAEIEKLLPKEYYKVGIIEFGDCPILIFDDKL